MSLIGSVSLTNNQDGLYLGKISIDNLNIDPNQILYSNDGINITGKTLSNGLSLNGDYLETTSNPNIQLTSNSIYVNDNEQTIQSGINSSSQADVIYISSGSFGESQIQINNKYNIALQAPSTASTICEILNGVVIDGTSELIRLSNLQIKGIITQIYGIGRHRLDNIVFSGLPLSINTIYVGHNSIKYMTFSNCEFDNYCVIQVPNTFASVIYFINCNFGGCGFSLSNISNQQVIFNNCAGFQSFPVNATYIGLNVLITGVSKVDTTNVNLTTINNAAYPPSGDMTDVIKYKGFQGGNHIGTTGPTNNLIIIPNLLVSNLTIGKRLLIRVNFTFFISTLLTINETINLTINDVIVATLYSTTLGTSVQDFQKHIFRSVSFIYASTSTSHNIGVLLNTTQGNYLYKDLNDFYTMEVNEIQ